MRHRKLTVKLGRTSAHRDSMLANQVCSLIHHRRVTTTVAKAKASRRLADKMVTLGKKGTLEARRRALSILKSKSAVGTLFSEIAPGFADRPGGYTRIIRLPARVGDAAERAILEWVQESSAPPPAKKKRLRDRRSSK